MRSLVPWLAGIGILLTLGCSKGKSAPEPEADDGPPPMTATEMQRGVEACAAYKARVCKCAEATGDAERKTECTRADARIDGLDLQLKLLGAQGEMTAQDRGAVQLAVRKATKACLEDTTALAATCP